MIIGITGQMGSGKTLFMSILAYAFSLKGVKVYSNYSLKNAQKLKSLNEMISISNGVLALDEIWLNIDSRFWYYNVPITRWVNQTRKKNLLVLYTTQNFSQVDVRLRRATDLLVWCFNMKNHFLYCFIEPQLGRILKLLKLEKEKAKEFFSIFNSFEFIKPLYFYRKRASNLAF